MKENRWIEGCLYLLGCGAFVALYGGHHGKHFSQGFEIARGLGWIAGLSLCLNVSFHLSMRALHRPWRREVWPRLRELTIYWMRLMMRNHRLFGILAGCLVLTHGTWMLLASGRYGTALILTTGICALAALLGVVTLGLIRGWSRRTKEKAIFDVVKIWHTRAAYIAATLAACHLLAIFTTQ